MQLLVATATLSALVGGILLLASVLRLGFVANFISAPVLTGFKSGIGLVIVLDQLPKLLGVHITKQGFFPDLWHLFQALPDSSGLTLLVALISFAILIGMMTGWLHVSDSQALLIMLGSLGTAWGMVMAFWFGTTNGSATKTELLAKAPAVRS